MSSSHSQVSEECRDLLRRILEPDPAERATVAEILAHPWLTAGARPGLSGINALLLGAPP